MKKLNHNKLISHQIYQNVAEEVCEVVISNNNSLSFLIFWAPTLGIFD